MNTKKLEFISLADLGMAYRKAKVDLFYAEQSRRKELAAFESELSENLKQLKQDLHKGKSPVVTDAAWTLVPKQINDREPDSDLISEDELDSLLLADSMQELVSYAVGCMFGRYALDRPGLMLANQGETIEDYHRKIDTTEHTEYTEKVNGKDVPSVSSVYSVVKNSFPADENNVIPMLDRDWFTDDIAERFRKFLRVAFGEEHYEENLRFVEQDLNIKGKRNYTIRDYFLGEFYTNHVKRYKKRPIYWLFSSGSGKSGGNFNALIYMHRYRPDTVSVVLNDYLREFRTKLTSHKNHLEAVSISANSAQAEKTKALKEIEKITKMIAEMEEYEREVLYPLATEQVEIDLDDGVKVNYPKLGAALKKIVGLDAKED